MARINSKLHHAHARLLMPGMPGGCLPHGDHGLNCVSCARLALLLELRCCCAFICSSWRSGRATMQYGTTAATNASRKTHTHTHWRCTSLPIYPIAMRMSVGRRSGEFWGWGITLFVLQYNTNTRLICPKCQGQSFAPKRSLALGNESRNPTFPLLHTLLTDINVTTDPGSA